MDQSQVSGRAVAKIVVTAAAVIGGLYLAYLIREVIGLVLIAAIFGIGLLIVPPLVTGVQDLSSNLPGYVDDLRHNKTFRDYDNRYHITQKLTEQAKQLPSKLGDAAGTLRDVTVGVF